jgi:4-hydroxy-tetrahydrodipicolinate synthase
MFKGSNVALITPFKNDKLDDETYIKLIHFHIDNGTNGLVPAGTTGESPTLSHSEHERVIELCVKESKGKLPVFAGTGSNSTEEAISLTKHAEKIGANGALVVTPYYNKPTQEGLFQHYKAINDKCGIPIIIYNIPGRSVIDMSVETMARLYELKNIIGVKDATGDLNRVDQTLKKLGSDFLQLTGNDDNALEFNKKGGEGAISVTANIAPKLCSEFQKVSNLKNVSANPEEAERLDQILQPLHEAMFVESNPSPVKYAAKILDLCDDTVRLPLVKVTDTTKDIIKKALKAAKLVR